MKIRTLLLMIIVLLFIVGFVGIDQINTNKDDALKSIKGAECGPCLARIGDDCGWPNNMGQCTWNGEGGGCGSSPTTDCGIACDATDNHDVCAGLFWSCTYSWVKCDDIIQPYCTVEGYGCRCQRPGSDTGLDCHRLNC